MSRCTACTGTGSIILNMQLYDNFVIAKLQQLLYAHFVIANIALQLLYGHFVIANL